MLHSLVHALRVLWAGRVDLFWYFWLSTTVAGAVLVIWVIPKRKGATLAPTAARRRDWSRSAVLAVAFLALLLVCYGVGSVAWEDFAYYDNSMFTTRTLVGLDLPPPIWPEAGRFFPLGHQEYNLLRHVTSSVVGYHSFRIVELVLLTGIVLLVLLDELSVQQRVALIILILVTPGVVTSFSGLIFPEANLILSLACLMWSMKRYEQAGSRSSAVAAIVSTQFLLYYKETAFLLILGLSFGRLVVRCRHGPQPGWDFGRLRDPQSRLDMCLAAMVAPFLLLYLAAMYPADYHHAYYAETYRLSLAQVLRCYLKVNLAVWIFVAVVSVRIVWILRRRVTPSLFWDGLALGGLGYVAGYLYLQMYTVYYLAPVDLIAVLYLGRWAVLSMEGTGIAAKAGVAALVIVVILQDVLFSAFLIYERKNIIKAKAELGHVIKARYENGQPGMRLFFPSAMPYWIMEFASYLNYLGVPVERLPTDSVATGKVQMIGRAIAEDGRCMFYREFACHPGNSAEPGDLIVELPDDFGHAEEFDSAARGRSVDMLFSYSPRPSIPQWLRPYVNHLHAGSPRFALRDRWLDASLVVWKSALGNG
jgi:hypothetical protein